VHLVTNTLFAHSGCVSREIFFGCLPIRSCRDFCATRHVYRWARFERRGFGRSFTVNGRSKGTLRSRSCRHFFRQRKKRVLSSRAGNATMKRSSFIVNPPRRRAALELRAPYTYTSYAHLSRARSLPAAPSPSGVGGLAAHALVMTCGFAAPMTSARTATASFGDDEEKRKQSRGGYFLLSSTL